LAGPVCQAQDDLTASLEAHGGLETWRDYAAVTYDFNLAFGTEVTRDDRHIVNLNTRQVRVDGESYTAAFDGEKAWVAPSRAAFDYYAPPRFYVQSYYYYFSMPFVFSDPGVNQEDMGQRTLLGRTFDVVRFYYGSDVGDTPEDTYLAYFNPVTDRLYAVNAAVTYWAERDNPNTLVLFEAWQEVDGLRVPERVRFYNWTGEKRGEELGVIEYSDVSFRSEAPPGSRFEMPESAVVDTSMTEGSRP
jgi:hypothetical protein